MSLKLFHVTTVPMTLEFLMIGQIPYMKSKGFEVSAVSSPGEALERVAERDGIAVHGIPIARGVSPKQDLLAFFRLWWLFVKTKPTIIHSSTGKAGPIAMIAATLAGVPARLYTLRGLMIDRRTGLTQFLIRLLERVTCLCAHRVLAVSRSVADLMVGAGLCPAEKITVPANGSSNGVDADNRFNPVTVGPEDRADLRARLGIPQDAPVVGFVGRLVKGKGVSELTTAWGRIKAEYEKAFLLVVGPLEDQDPVPEPILYELRNDGRVIMIDFIPHEEMPRFYASIDMVALPTYSEGLPNVSLEAAAMEVPVVATAVSGCVDVIQDGVTGILVQPGDADGLADAIKTYIDHPDLGRRHGKAARERVLRDFRQELVWESVYTEYVRLLLQKGLRPPGEPCESPTGTNNTPKQGLLN